MNFTDYFKLFALVLSIFSTSCVRQFPGDLQKIKNDRALFIAMPQSSFAFENIGPNVYTALVEQFRRMGYFLVNSVDLSEYSLTTIITDLSPRRRYISPDVLLFNYSLKLDITCFLKDEAGKLIKEKQFTFSTLISKAKSPILNSSFFECDSLKLFSFAAPQIELYFRPYLLA